MPPPAPLIPLTWCIILHSCCRGGIDVSSIGLAVGLVCGSALGLLLISLYPAGLDPNYGIIILALALAALLASILGWGTTTQARRTMWAGLLMAFVFIGCGRALLIHPPVTPSDLAYYNSGAQKVSGTTIVTPTSTTRDAVVVVTGLVSAEPVFSDRSQRLRISARSIELSDNVRALAIGGDMYAIVARYPE